MSRLLSPAGFLHYLQQGLLDPQVAFDVYKHTGKCRLPYPVSGRAQRCARSEAGAVVCIRF